MAENKTNAKKIKIRLFKGSGRYAEDVTVIVNGKVFLIKRGETVEVPEYVAKILEQQEYQLETAKNIK